MEITTRGTKIKSGKRYRQYVNNCAEILESSGFEELLVPYFTPRQKKMLKKHSFWLYVKNKIIWG